MPAPVLLFLGAGPNVGLAVMKKFRADGYKIAAVARSEKPEITSAADKFITADLSADPANITAIFKEVQDTLGRPNVVVYNGYGATFAPDGSEPFKGVSPQALEKNLKVNTVSAYAAAAAFADLPATANPSDPNVFIYTGNMQGALLVDQTMTLGVGKNATYYFIELAANTYGKATPAGSKGFWYVADERTEKGYSVMTQIDGEAHAEFYAELARSKEQKAWNATFVKGKGYVDFETSRDRPLASVAGLMQQIGAKWPPA
ncbi:uncharacterized protein BDZ99DRAFT_423044 [Mytilinidion resinicola]|uniref:NAD(P)-binding protein n=1 Tax=Mytilinidion resinicola TaxID=574789 RepID=A0A6A6YCW4_9PEZI|nr:uncharacterized protein BDZ99DRAFT_423044 [Mytilinidion resinicola]KAF2806550.1 hypothetical protein BDZ99DRAFT_423044 [Mytilinidion resinicola]